MVTCKDDVERKNVFVSLTLPRWWFFDRCRKSLLSMTAASKNERLKRKGKEGVAKSIEEKGQQHDLRENNEINYDKRKC